MELERREARTRADSIATAIFVLGGGALSVSIATLLNSAAGTDTPENVKELITRGWTQLLWSIALALVFKAIIVAQGYWYPKNYRHPPLLFKIASFVNILIGLSSIALFIAGMVALGDAAVKMLESADRIEITI